MSLSVLKDVLLFVSDFYEIDLPFKQLFLGAGIQSVCSWRMEPPNQSSKWMIEDTAWGARVPHQQNLEPIVLYTKNSIYQICEVVPAHLWNAPLSFEKKTGYTSDLFHSVCGSFFFPDGTLMLVVNWLISLLENQIKTIGFKYFLFSSLLEEMIQFD